jgi:hypothetical protein
MVARVYENYREARRSLKRAIGELKKRAWHELQATLDSDPWGRPYRVVLNKLRPWWPSVTEGMDGGRNSISQRGKGIATPKSPVHGRGLEPGTGGLRERTGRSRWIRARKGPGPDGIPARLWKGTVGELTPRLRRLFDRCLAWGEFPGLWKEGRMVLLPKPGRHPDSPSAFRPLCLLDELGKVLERVVAARMEVHMSRALPGLQEGQYGFRRGRSTTDAIIRVRSLVEEAERRGWVALVVSLDIENAFNSLPW